VNVYLYKNSNKNTNKVQENQAVTTVQRISEYQEAVSPRCFYNLILTKKQKKKKEWNSVKNTVLSPYSKVVWKRYYSMSEPTESRLIEKYYEPQVKGNQSIYLQVYKPISNLHET
jgi:hypothetical protein